MITNIKGFLMAIDIFGLKGDIFANPFQKVWKQYQPDGHYDSITSFYEISENVAEIISRKTKEEKKVWWKFW
jgi:hypothetical protein